VKLIGAAVQRTGTMSTQAALEILGFKAYHMAEAVTNYEKGDLDQWNAAFEGTGTPDWEKMLREYDATTDNPSCFFYKELMEAFPDALVLLNQRDPEKWCNSMEKILEVEDMIGKKLGFLPRFRETYRLFVNSRKNFFGTDRSRENLINACCYLG